MKKFQDHFRGDASSIRLFGLLDVCQALNVDVYLHFDAGLRDTEDGYEYTDLAVRGWYIVVGGYAPTEDIGRHKVFQTLDDAITAGFDILDSLEIPELA
jgi:hypothetical protein